MLKKIDIHLNVLILLGAITLNHIFFLSPYLTFLTKINFLIFIFFSIFYFLKFKENKILFIFIIILLVVALGTPTTSWDARSIWLLKAKIIFYDQSILSINANSPGFSNNSYPIIASAFAASFVNIIGHWNEIFPKAAFTLMFIPPLILINKFIHNNYFLLTIILILFIVGKYLINGELDGLLSVYFVASAMMFYNLKNNNNSYIYCSILILLNIILTLLKTEGTILLISLVIGSLIIFYAQKKKFSSIILISAISFLPVLIWNIFCIYASQNGSDLNNAFKIDNLTSRIFFLKNYIIIFEHLLFNEKFLFSLFILILSLFFFKNNKILYLVLNTSIIYILFLFIIYLSTSLDLQWHLNSASRVIKPIALFFSVFSIYNVLNKNKNILE
jgi:hypothetical protein